MKITATPFLMVLLFAGCSPAPTSSAVSGSCDTRSVNDVCTDYEGSADVVGPYKSACTPGTWSSGTCDRTGSVGGCQSTDASLGLTSTQWSFPPQTAASVMAACQSPATFITP
jgi:hypothetical protein